MQIEAMLAYADSTERQWSKNHPIGMAGDCGLSDPAFTVAPVWDVVGDDLEAIKSAMEKYHKAVL